MRDGADDHRTSIDRQPRWVRWARLFDAVGFQLFVGLEVAFVLPIALLARWLPDKRGGNMDFAPYLLDEPTYLDSVLVNVVVLNVLLFAVGVVLLVGVKVLEAREGTKSDRDQEHPPEEGDRPL